MSYGLPSSKPEPQIKSTIEETETIESVFSQDIQGLVSWKMQGLNANGARTFVAEMVLPPGVIKQLQEDLNDWVGEHYL